MLTSLACSLVFGLWDEVLQPTYPMAGCLGKQNITLVVYENDDSGSLCNIVRQKTVDIVRCAPIK